MKKLFTCLLLFFIPIYSVSSKYYSLYEDDVIKEEIRSMNHLAIFITVISSLIIYLLYMFIYRKKVFKKNNL